MSDYRSSDGVRDAVESHGNVMSVTMADLRTAYGAGRLSVHVVNHIGGGLAGRGIGHFPELSTDQVRQFGSASSVSR